jgi:AcrR family transcriptional regulator
MQQVVDETGLGKSLLYREFASKDDLVAAWLRESDLEWWKIVDNDLQRFDGDPVRQLLALIELTHESVKSPDFHGCIFYNTSTEFREHDHPGRQEALAHMRRMRERILALAHAAAITEPADLADGLMLLIAGLYVNGAALGSTGPARAAVTTAKALIQQYSADVDESPMLDTA